MKRLIDFSSRFRILKGGKVSLVVSAFLGGAVIASAAPSGGTVTSGDATISQNGAVTNINQSTQKASINWNDFSIKANETVNFNQPNSSSITLNRVIGNEKSIIDGALNANGQVWILNSNGILFNSSAKVNTAGILATTAELSDSDFQNGNYNFKNSSKNSVINLGTIEVANSGYVVLASNEVKNAGTIKAVKGKVHLVGADEYTLNLNGNSIVNLLVNKGVLDAMVENSGTIIADGGEIYLTTNAVNELLRGVVNNTGIIEANSLDGLTGKVELFAHGGTANVSGTIEAKDGFVETSGEKLSIKDGTIIKAKDWLLDPTNITIASGGAETLAGDPATTTATGDVTISASTIQTALATTNVTLEATNDITVNEALTNDTAGNKVLTLKADSDGDNTGGINVNAVITVGAGDRITLNYGSNSNLTMARDDSTNSFTGKINLDSSSVVNINNSSYTVVHNVTTLDNMRNTLNGKYVLAGDLTAIGAFSSIGSGSNGFEFTGKFDGLGHTLSGITINEFLHTGVFGGVRDASIQNIGVTGTTVTQTDTSTGVTGGLIGLATNSQISNSFFEGTINGSNQTGGLIGGVTGSTIKNSYSKGTVNTTTNGGGLIGAVNNSILHAAFGANSIENSYSTSNVASSGASAVNNIGGLIGSVSSGTYASTVANSYATGTVTNASTGFNTGGLVGSSAGGTYTTSYATGDVSSQGGYIGGFIGTISTNAPAIIRQSYSTSDIYEKGTSQQSIGGFIGSHSGGTLTISDSYHEGVVDGHTYATNSAVVGGFLGGNNNGLSITNSYHKGAVSGTGGYIGGFIGQLTSSSGATTLQNNYAAATMSNASGAFVGGFVGNKDNFSATTNWNKNFWDSELSAISHAYKNNTDTAITPSDGTITGKTTADMQKFSTFSGAGWTIGLDANLSQNAYPVLVTENGVTSWKIYGTFIPVSYTLTNIATGNYIYDRTSQLPTTWNATSIFGGSYNDWVLGTDYYLYYNGFNYTGFTDAGTYNNISINVVKAGYDETATGSTAGSLVIDKKDITAITGITASNKVYNRTTAAILDTSAASFTGMISGDTLNVATSTGTFDNWNVGTDKTVSISGLILGGASVGNYNLTDITATTTANITAKALTFTSIDAVTTTYGTPAATGAVTFSGVEVGDTVTASANVFSPTYSTSGNLKAETYSQYATLGGANAGNYSITGFQAGSYVVNKLAIAGSIANSSSIYGDDPTTAYNSVLFSNVVSGDVINMGSRGLADSTAVGDFATTNGTVKFDAGSYKVFLGSLTGADLANYSVNDGTNYYITGDHTITKKSLNVSGLTAGNKVYNRDATASLSGTEALTNGASSNTDGLYYTGDTVSLTGTASGAFADWNVGTGKTVTVSGLSLAGASANNYSLNPITTTANITAKPLTLTSIGAVTTTYGTPAATGAVTFSGVETGDTVTALANVLLPSYSTSNNLKAGTYFQYATLGGDNAGNYSIVGGQNNYVVNRLAIAGTMANSSTVYGDSLNFGTVTFSNVIAGDNVVTGNQGLANSSNKLDIASANSSGKFDVGNYTSQLRTLGGLDLANYAFDDGTNYYITASHEIIKANATVTANSATKIYNGLTQSVNGFSASGLVNGETIAVLNNVTSTGASGLDEGTYTATVSGTDENYNLTFINGRLIITKATPIPTPQLAENQNTVRDVITPISNTLVLNNFNPKPRVDVNKPSVKTPENNSVNVASQPMAGSGNKLVTMSELKETKTEENDAGNVNQDFMVPLGDNSTIQLVNAGVNLPEGVEQLFFVSTNENQEN